MQSNIKKKKYEPAGENSGYTTLIALQSWINQTAEIDIFAWNGWRVGWMENMGPVKVWLRLHATWIDFFFGMVKLG